MFQLVSSHSKKNRVNQFKADTINEDALESSQLINWQMILIDCERADDLIRNRIVLELDGFRFINAQIGSKTILVLSEFSRSDLFSMDILVEVLVQASISEELELLHSDMTPGVPVLFLNSTSTDSIEKIMSHFQGPYSTFDFLEAAHNFLNPDIMQSNSVH